MRTVIETMNGTLDGMMQAPARANEGVRGGSSRGGWALPYDDEVKVATIAGTGVIIATYQAREE